MPELFVAVSIPDDTSSLSSLTAYLDGSGGPAAAVDDDVLGATLFAELSLDRVVIPVTQLDDDGADPASLIAADVVRLMCLPFNDTRVVLEVVNDDVVDHQVTIETPGTIGSGLAVADQVVPVAAGATKLIGPLAPAVYNQSDGTVNVNPSVNTTLRFRAYRL